MRQWLAVDIGNPGVSTLRRAVPYPEDVFREEQMDVRRGVYRTNILVDTDKIFIYEFEDHLITAWFHESLVRR